MTLAVTLAVMPAAAALLAATAVVAGVVVAAAPLPTSPVSPPPGGLCLSPLQVFPGLDVTGGTDVAAALQATKARASVLKVPVCVPAGTYFVGSPISLTAADSGLLWQSDPGAHYVVEAGANASILRADKAARITVDGGEWDGNMAAQSSDNGGALLDFVSTDFVTVRNAFVHDGYIVGVRTIGTNNQVVDNRFGAGRRDLVLMTNDGSAAAHGTRASRNRIDRSAQAPPTAADTTFGWGIDIQAGGGADMVDTEIADNTILYPAGSGASASNGPIQLLGHDGATRVQRHAVVARNRLDGGGESIASGSLLDGAIENNVATNFTAACIEANVNAGSPITGNSCRSATASTGIYEDNGTSGSPITGNSVTLTAPEDEGLQAIFFFLSSGAASDNVVAIPGGRGKGIVFQQPPGPSTASGNRITGSFDDGVLAIEPVDVAVDGNSIEGSRHDAIVFVGLQARSSRYVYSATDNRLAPAAGGTILESFRNAPTLTGSVLKGNVSTSGPVPDVSH